MIFDKIFDHKEVKNQRQATGAAANHENESLRNIFLQHVESFAKDFLS